MSRRRWIFYLSLLCGWPAATNAALPPSYRAGQLTLQAEVDYFQTTANYDDSGSSFERLEPGHSYQNILTTLGLGYAYNPQWELFGHLGIAYAQSDDDNYTRDNSQLTEVKLGARYLLARRPFFIVPEIFAIAPLNSFSEGTDETLTGEGAFALQGGAWFKKKFLTLDNYFYLAARYQSGGRALLMPYELGTNKPFSDLEVGGSIGGYFTVVEDQFTDDPSQRTDVTDRVNGGSLRYYSVNPQLLEVRGWVGMKFTKNLLFRIGYGQTINGANTAAGSSIFSLLVWRTNWQTLFGTSPDDDGIIVRKKKLKEFKVEEDGYDESLFQEDPPPRKKKTRRQRKKKVNEQNQDTDPFDESF